MKKVMFQFVLPLIALVLFSNYASANPYIRCEHPVGPRSRLTFFYFNANTIQAAKTLSYETRMTAGGRPHSVTNNMSAYKPGPLETFSILNLRWVGQFLHITLEGGGSIIFEHVEFGQGNVQFVMPNGPEMPLMLPYCELLVPEVGATAHN